MEDTLHTTVPLPRYITVVFAEEKIMLLYKLCLESIGSTSESDLYLDSNYFNMFCVS